MICFARTTCVTAALLLAGGCDSGAPAKTSDEIAGDSALAADLALANRDTLLIDSIGQYRPPEGAVVDTGVAVTGAPGVTARVGTASSSKPPAPTAKVTPAPPAQRTASVPASPAPATAPRPSAAPSAPTATSPARRSGDPCNSPALADQQACVHARLATADMRLNRIYRALITEMRREEGIKGGQKDPPSVERLRVAQRTWLVYRDTECRRRGRGKEGPLWARKRVACLGQFAIRRANELADNFSRLTAH